MNCTSPHSCLHPCAQAFPGPNSCHHLECPLLPLSETLLLCPHVKRQWSFSSWIPAEMREASLTVVCVFQTRPRGGARLLKEGRDPASFPTVGTHSLGQDHPAGCRGSASRPLPPCALTLPPATSFLPLNFRIPPPQLCLLPSLLLSGRVLLGVPHRRGHPTS